MPLPQAKELFDLGMNMSQTHYQLMFFLQGWWPEALQFDNKNTLLLAQLILVEVGAPCCSVVL